MFSCALHPGWSQHPIPKDPITKQGKPGCLGGQAARRGGTDRLRSEPRRADGTRVTGRVWLEGRGKAQVRLRESSKIRHKKMCVCWLSPWENDSKKTQKNDSSTEGTPDTSPVCLRCQGSEVGNRALLWWCRGWRLGKCANLPQQAVQWVFILGGAAAPCTLLKPLTRGRSKLGWEVSQKYGLT